MPTTVLLCLLAALSTAPREESGAPSQAEVDAAVQRACDLLVANQEVYVPDPPVGRLPEDGLADWQAGESKRLAGLREEAGDEAREWPYEGVYRVAPDGRIPPGYRVGGTAIVCEALLHAPGFDEVRRAAVLRGVDFMLDMVADDPGLAPAPQVSYDVRCWGQAYALSFLVQAGAADLFADDEARAARVAATIPRLIEGLHEGALATGGWNYAGGRRGLSPFMTGAVLIALYRARDAGHDVDADVVHRALTALTAARPPGIDGGGDKSAYVYSGTLADGQTVPMAGAGARTAIAELALIKGGTGHVSQLRSPNDMRLGTAVEGFLAEENWQALLARKSRQGTHEPPYGVAPYYFFFGHWGAALAAEHLPPGGRPARRERLRELLWRTIDESGGWNDRVFPRTESYGTAAAVLALIAPDLPPVPRWPDPWDRKLGAPKPEPAAKEGAVLR